MTSLQGGGGQLPACNLRGPLRPCEGDADFYFHSCREIQSSCDDDNSVGLCIDSTGGRNIRSRFAHYTALYHISPGCIPSEARELGDWVLAEHGQKVENDAIHVCR